MDQSTNVGRKAGGQKNQNREINVGEEADGDGEEIIDAPEEEVDVKRTLPNLEMPTQSEIDHHRESHCPYRSWCDACVEGRGREKAHKTIDMSARQYQRWPSTISS